MEEEESYDDKPDDLAVDSGEEESVRLDDYKNLKDKQEDLNERIQN